MTLFQTLFAQGKRAYRSPREAAADVMSLGITGEVLAPVFFVVVISTVIVDALASTVLPFAGPSSSPFVTVIVQCLFFLGFAFAITKVGQAFNGTGTFFNAVLLLVFVQAALLPAQVALIALFTLIPNIQLFLVVAFGFAIFALWVNVGVVAALHGFESNMKAFGVAILATFATAIAFMVLLSLVAPSLVS